MEFSEKLLALRKQKGWTQEELAEALYVSRTAISKWESGRGYPNIESLKAISKLFSVSIDNLLSNEELITVAETDSKEKAYKTHTVIFGLVDCMVGLLMFLPFFSQQFGEQYISVSIMQLTDISAYIKALYITLIAFSALLGILQLALQNIENRFWQLKKNHISIILSIIGLLCFILSNQPYAGVFLLFILIIKGFLTLKTQ